VPERADRAVAADDGRSGRSAPGGRIGRLHVLVDSVALADAALAGGAPTLQVRVKDGSDRERFAVVAAVAERCRLAGASCIVDDRADMAVAAGADGVHVGALDLPVDAVRHVVGPDLLVGATARDPDTARRLVAAGADYLGVGPTFATRSKDGLPAPLGPAGVGAVAAAVDVPVVAIAGITRERVPEVLAAGAWGVAVIGAVRRAVDPVAATRSLVDALGVGAGAGHG
jgi:thiamine-phosphate pyrophosphorylase